MTIEDTGILLRLPPPTGCRVMVVDDDPLVRERLQELLKSSGYETQVAESGERALALARMKSYQIVITDWEMRGLSGPELCRELRRDNAERFIYIIIFTVRSARADVLNGLEAGADDYLLKTECEQVILARVDVGRRTAGMVESLRVSAEENRRLSVTDALTGAYNRRFLMKHLPRELSRARRYGRALAVLSCDIDRFKHINDRFGHESGDDVLKEFFTRSSACLRQGIDWIARAGGEEFVFVLPETTLAGALRAAEKIRQSLKAQAIMTRSGPVNATVSIGTTAVATPPELGAATAADLLRLSDEAMYSSKSSGRDRTSALAPDGARSVPCIDFFGHRQELYRSKPALAPPQQEHGDRFDHLKEAFHQRLGSDRSELLGLREEAEREPVCVRSIAEKLQALAHRVAGAAALFGQKNIMNAAIALEQVSMDSQLPLPSGGRDKLRGAIHSLLNELPQVLAHAPTTAAARP